MSGSATSDAGEPASTGTSAPGRVPPVLWVSGVDDARTEVLRRRLPHGADPEQLLWAAGYAPVRAVAVHGRSQPHQLVLEYAVRRADDLPAVAAEHDGGPSAAAPGHGPGGASPVEGRSGDLPARDPRRDAGLVLSDGEVPVPRQRVAVYAFCRSDRGLLLTEFSDRTHAPHQWGLPGGGIDAGELPEAALHREIDEETGQSVQVESFLGVHDAHWVGRAPSGRIEDLHAVRLLYLATCAEPSEPVVHDVGGTTWSAAWVPFEQVRRVPLTGFWRRVIDTWWPAVVSG